MEESASSMAEEDAKRKKFRQRLYRVGVLVSLYCQCYSKYSFQLQTFYNIDQWYWIKSIGTTHHWSLWLKRVMMRMILTASSNKSYLHWLRLYNTCTCMHMVMFDSTHSLWDSVLCYVQTLIVICALTKYIRSRHMKLGNFFYRRDPIQPMHADSCHQLQYNKKLHTWLGVCKQWTGLDYWTDFWPQI